MKKKIIRRYMLLCIPFICGTLLYILGLYGIVSSLLFFGGGYVLIKNLFDYRKINKNINKCLDRDLRNDDIDKISDDDILCKELDNFNNSIIKENIDINVGINNVNKYSYEYRKSDSICGLKSTRLHSKVRRRY